MNCAADTTPLLYVVAVGYLTRLYTVESVCKKPPIVGVLLPT